MVETAVKIIDLKALSAQVAQARSVATEVAQKGESIVTAGRIAAKRPELGALPEAMPLFQVVLGKDGKTYTNTLTLYRSTFPGSNGKVRPYDAAKNAIDAPLTIRSYSFDGRGIRGSAVVEAWGLQLLVEVGLKAKCVARGTATPAGDALNAMAFRPHFCRGLAGFGEGTVFTVVELVGVGDRHPYYNIHIGDDTETKIEIASTETLEAYIKANGGQLPLSAAIDRIEDKEAKAKKSKDPEIIKIVHLRDPEQESLDDL